METTKIKAALETPLNGLVSIPASAIQGRFLLR
jgi:hypothetical protein